MAEKTPPTNLSQNGWRNVLRAVSDELMSLPEGAPCPAHPVAAHLGERALHVPPVDLKKTELYAAARPAIKEVAAAALIGVGTETRFVPDMFPITITPDIARHTELTVFMVEHLFFRLSDYMKHGRSPRFDTFNEAALTHRYHKFIPDDAVSRGCLPSEILQFGLLTAPLIREHPLTASLDAAERIDTAHDLSSILMGRAMTNIANVDLRPELSTLIGEVNIRLLSGTHQLVGTDGRPLDVGHGLAGNVGPTLKCPAHDYLERFVAAGVNLLGDAGYYHPDVPPANLTQTKIVFPA
jgi:hypothetical protein